jgi:hypothetical protein
MNKMTKEEKFGSLIKWEKTPKSVNKEGTEFRDLGNVSNFYSRIFDEDINSNIVECVDTETKQVRFFYKGIRLILNYSNELGMLYKKHPEIFNFLDCFNVIEYKKIDQDPKATLSIKLIIPAEVVLDDDYKKNYNPRIRKLYKLLEGF